MTVLDDDFGEFLRKKTPVDSPQCPECRDSGRVVDLWGEERTCPLCGGDGDRPADGDE